MKISYSPAAAIHQGSFLRHFFYLALVSFHLKPSCQCSSVCIQLQFVARVISGPPGAEVIKSQIRNDDTPVIAVWSGERGTVASPLLPCPPPLETFLFCSNAASCGDHEFCEQQSVVKLPTAAPHIRRPSPASATSRRSVPWRQGPT